MSPHPPAGYGEDHLPRGLDPSIRVYRGKSMSGTFEAGDLLRIDRVAMGELRLGDVVVFARPRPGHEPCDLVHRVREIRREGLVVRGDDNDADDRELVRADQLMGRVSSLERGNEICRVLGGPRGRLWARRLRIRRRLARFLLRTARGLVGMPYRWLRRTGGARWVWRPRLQRIRLVIEGEVFVTVRCRGREVARLHPRTGHLVCRKPFDLILWHERGVGMSGKGSREGVAPEPAAKRRHEER